MASQGPSAGGTFGTNTSVGTATWSNAASAASANGSTASSNVTESGSSHYLLVTNFGFSIPAGATINGIEAAILRRTGSPDFVKDSSVKLFLSGSPIGSEKASASNWPADLETATYGGAADVWGTALTVANINASTFGIGVSALNLDAADTSNAEVDFISLTVHYTEAPSFITQIIVT